MNELPRNVILDLLPLYLAGEVSEDTAVLVKKYLETDLELAKMAEQMKESNLLNKVSVPFSKEIAMETYQEAKKWMVIRTLGLVTVGAIVFLCTLVVTLLFITIYLK
jgi:hypothetical protein